MKPLSITILCIILLCAATTIDTQQVSLEANTTTTQNSDLNGNLNTFAPNHEANDVLVLRFDFVIPKSMSLPQDNSTAVARVRKPRGIWREIGNAVKTVVIDGCLSIAMTFHKTLNGAFNNGYRRKRSLEVEGCELLKILFEKSDINKDGRLSLDEFRIDSFDAFQGMSVLDTDNSSYLEPKEIHPCLTRLNSPQIKKGHSRGRRSFTFTYNGQTIYSSDWVTQNRECNQNDGTVTTIYYVPSQGVIYI